MSSDWDLLTDEEYAGSLDFDNALRCAGEGLADKMYPGLRDCNLISVISSAQDRDALVLPLRNKLRPAEKSKRREGRPTFAISSVWNSYRPATESANATNMIVAQNNEDHPDRVNVIVGLSLCLAEAASVADNLSRMATVIRHEQLLLGVVFACPKEIDDLRYEFEARGRQAPNVIALSIGAEC